MFNNVIKNRYVLGNFSRRGGYGIFYVANDNLTSKQVGLKEIIRQNIDNIDDIRMESEFLASFNHPNVITYYESFFENNCFYIITEYCYQGSFYEAFIQKKKLVDEAIIDEWLYQAIDALKYIHQRKILHRDINPNNIFLMNNQIKLGDFGISIEFNGILTVTSSFATHMYQAPEILAKKKYNEKLDIWALGVTFYELCSLNKPYRSTSDVCLNTKVENIKNVSVELNDIIKGMMMHEMEKRIDSETVLNLLKNKNKYKCVKTLTGHTSSVLVILESKIGNKLISASDDNTIKVWDMINFKCLFTLLGHKGAIWSLLELDTGELVSASSDSTIKIWDMNNKECIITLNGHIDIVTCLLKIKSGKLISGSSDSTIKIWDLISANCVTTLKGHNKLITCLAEMKTGEIISGSDDHTIKIWNINTKVCIMTLIEHKSGIENIQVLKNGNLICGHEDGIIQIWDLKTYKCLNKLNFNLKSVFYLFEMNNEEIIGAFNDDSIKILDIKRKNIRTEIKGHTSVVNCVLESKTGKIIISASKDKTIKIWGK